MNEPNFWDDHKSALIVVNELNEARKKTETLEKLNKQINDLEAIVELLSAEVDKELLELAVSDLEKTKKLAAEMQQSILFQGEYDEMNAIVVIHAGAGGTESQDWASMLYRMYVRFSERHGFKVQTVDYQAGGEAGISSATLIVRGQRVYGLLKGEKGVHRLVRISPFDAAGRRHTSFAGVNVIPEFSN